MISDFKYNSYLAKRRKWIGYFDILGFKEYIKKTDLLKAVKEIDSTFREGIEKAVKSSNTEITLKDSQHPILVRHNFADSILFSINPQIGLEAAFHYMVVSSAILIAKFAEKDFLLRGSISYGQLFVEHNYQENSIMVIGKGLVDANKWQKNQKWAGCVINPEMHDVWKVLLRSNAWAFSSLRKNKTLREYDVPLKRETTQKNNLYAIDWTKFVTPDFQDKVKEFIIRRMAEISEKNCDVLIKLKNTLTFMEKVIDAKLKNS